MMPHCTIAPTGWRCTRKRGHTGPCAAVPDPFGPAHVHESHDVCEEDIIGLISDPVCQKCRASVHDTPQLLMAPCTGDASAYTFPAAQSASGFAQSVVTIDDKSPPGSWARHIEFMDALKPKPRASLGVRIKRAYGAAVRELSA